MCRVSRSSFRPVPVRPAFRYASPKAARAMRPWGRGTIVPIANLYPAALGALLAGMLMGAAPAAALSQSEIAMLTGPERQQILEQGARREGAVIIYSGIIVDQALRPLVEGFARKYPFVKAEFWRGDSRPI